MSIRISGATIPNDKRIEIALTYIFGIGKTSSNDILKKIKIDKNTRVKDLSEDKVKLLRDVIEKEYKIEGDLKREIVSNIRRLKEINCYRGVRHDRRLPVRGQRTKTNSRSVRGNRRQTSGSGRRQSDQKT